MMDLSRPTSETTLLNPGLVLNTADAEHCVHACFQMLYRTKIGGAVPSFDDLDDIMRKVPGKYTWEYALLANMATSGFDVRIIWNIDLDRLAQDAGSYLVELYGPEVGQVYVENSELSIVESAARELANSQAVVELRSPNFSDIRSLLSDGYYITMTINQRHLQADPGYVAHSIVIFGVSERGVRIHNPGPPATEASEIAWDLLGRAWSDPDESARNIMAVRPSETAGL